MSLDSNSEDYDCNICYYGNASGRDCPPEAVANEVGDHYSCFAHDQDVPSGTVKYTADKSVKYDTGKTDMSYLEYFPLALEAVCKVSEFGGDKGYIRGSFKDVQHARKRYTAAMLRHYFAEGPLLGEPNIDPESGLEHDFAVAWNALCRLELRLREVE